MPSKRSVWVIGLLGLVGLTSLAGGVSQADSIGFSLASQERPGSQILIKVLEEGSLRPIADARITVEESLLSGANAQSGRSDLQGLLRVTRVTRVTQTDSKPRSVTVVKEGYAAVSIVGVQAQDVTVFLRPLPATQDVIVSGTHTGWPNSPGGDNVQAGLVFKTLSATDLLGFQLDSFFSPIKDTIDVLGPRQIPSNLTFPRQDIPVVIDTIHLDKMDYRLPMGAGSAVRMAGLQGHGRVRDLRPHIGSKMNVDILNQMTFTRIGYTAAFIPNANHRENLDSVIDLVANQHEVIVNKPSFLADVIVAAVTDLEGDRTLLMPSDLKAAINSKKPEEVRTVRLAALPQQAGRVRDIVTVAVQKGGKLISGIVTENAGQAVRPGEFMAVKAMLNVLALPETVTFHAPEHGIGAVIFEAAARPAVEMTADEPKPPVKSTYPVWTVFTLPSAGEVIVPSHKIPPAAPIRRYSVAGFEFDPAFSERQIDGTSIMRKLGRFVRTSADVTER